MPSNQPTFGSARRTRTPSDLKWLLNERAALRGAVEVASHRQATLAKRAARLEVLLAEARLGLTQVAEETAELTTRIHALDATIVAMHAGVAPDAAGAVRAWAGNYGQRGALTDFIREYLHTVQPRAVYCSEIKREAITRFELHLRTPQERALMGNKVRNALLRLRDLHGVAQSTESWQGGKQRQLWSWKQDSSLGALLEAACAAEAADECDEYPHAL